MSRARKAAEDTLVLMASRIAATVIGVLSLVLYTRLVVQTDLAVVAIYTMLSGICYQFSQLGLGVYVQRRMPRLQEQSAEQAMMLSRSYAAVTVSMLLLCCLVLVVVADHLPTLFFKHPDSARIILLLIPAVMVSSWQTVLTQIMRGRGMFTQLAIFTTATSVVYPASVICPYLLYGVTGMVLGVAAGGALTSLVPTWLHRRYVFGRVRPRQVAHLVKESWPFYVEGFMSYLKLFADQWLVAVLLTPADLAVYFVPKTICLRLLTFLDSMTNVMVANLSSISAQGLVAAKNAFEKIRRAYIYLLVPACMVFVASSFFVMDVLTTEQYQRGAGPLAILGASLLMQGLYAPHGVGVMTLMRPKYRLISLAVGLSAYFGFLAALGPWGLHGVASALLLSWLVQGIVTSRLLKQTFTFDFDRQAARTVALPCLFMLSVVVGGQAFFYHPFMVPVYLAVGLAIYVCLFLRNVSREDLETLTQALPAVLRWLVPLGHGLRRMVTKYPAGYVPRS